MPPRTNALPSYTWPETLSRGDALVFTGLSATLFARLESAGSITGRKFGPRGARIYRTDDLRRLVASLFAAAAHDIDAEFGTMLERTQ